MMMMMIMRVFPDSGSSGQTKTIVTNLSCWCEWARVCWGPGRGCNERRRSRRCCVGSTSRYSNSWRLCAVGGGGGGGEGVRVIKLCYDFVQSQNAAEDVITSEMTPERRPVSIYYVKTKFFINFQPLSTVLLSCPASNTLPYHPNPNACMTTLLSFSPCTLVSIHDFKSL